MKKFLFALSAILLLFGLVACDPTVEEKLFGYTVTYTPGLSATAGEEEFTVKLASGDSHKILPNSALEVSEAKKSFTSKALKANQEEEKKYAGFRREDYSFYGWVDQDGKYYVYNPNDKTDIKFTKNVILEALWVGLNGEIINDGDLKAKITGYTGGVAETLIIPRVMTVWATDAKTGEKVGKDCYVTEIDGNAVNNTSLTTVIIPDTVEKIAGNAFSGCANLTTVEFKSTTPPVIGANALPSSVENVIVPSGENSDETVKIINNYQNALSSLTDIQITNKDEAEEIQIDDIYMLKPGNSWYEGLIDDEEKITKITFTDTKPSTITSEGVDLTYGQTGKVMGYVSGTEVYVVGKKIYGNYDCENMFAYFYSDHANDTDGDYCAVSSLSEINGLEYLDTSKVVVMKRMFDDCSSVKSLNISNWNTSNVENMYCMFGDCKGLESLDLSNWDTSNVTDMRYMFSYCKGLKSITFGDNWKTSNVTNMAGMFETCSSLQSLDLSKFDTSNVTDMSWMFSGCKGLKSLDGSKFDTSNVTTFYRMFYGCSGLKSLDVSKFNTSNVTEMGMMFCNCSGLETLDLSNFNTSKVIYMTDMFNGCSSLKALVLSNFDTTNVKDMRRMFQDCSSLTLLDLSSFNTSKVEDSEYSEDMFKDCGKSGTTITIKVNYETFFNSTELGSSPWNHTTGTNTYTR